MTDEPIDSPLIVDVNGKILGQLQIVIPRRDYSFVELATVNLATWIKTADDAPVLTCSHVAYLNHHAVHGPCLRFAGDREVLTRLPGFKRLW